MTFQGAVVGPSFECDVDEIDFGPVPFGFPSTRYITLSNTSPIPMTYNLRLPADSPAASEVEVEPATDTIPAHGARRIAVDITPRWTESYDLSLHMDIPGVAEEALVVPMQATCVVPEVELATTHVDYKRCFLGYKYTATVAFRNPSAMPAKYQLIPHAIMVPADGDGNGGNGGGDGGEDLDELMRKPRQRAEDDDDADYVDDGSDDGQAAGQHQQQSTAKPKVELSCSPMSGVLAPNATTDVTLELVANSLGALAAIAEFEVLGSPDPPLQVHVHCIGQGAVIAPSESHVDWGVVPVLQDIVKTISLSNESKIAAEFACTIAGKGTPFWCEPTSGRLEPGASTALQLHLDLNDPRAFEDVLTVSVDNAQDQRVRLSVHGKGPTVVFDQDVRRIDFGQQFASRECEREFVVTNKGRFTQRVAFKLDAPGPGVDGHCTIMRGASFKKKRTPVCPDPPDPDYSIFGMYPEAVTLQPGESTRVYLRGYINSIQVCEVVVSERKGEGECVCM